MTTTSIKNLDWGQRLAIISGTNATDDTAATVFGVSKDEIATARETVKPAKNFDISPYASHFSTTASTSDAATADSATDAPTSGTTVKVPKKRGNPGSKVKTAFHAVTTTPVPVEEFAEKHGVSVNVLVQKKRFTTDADGNVLPEFAGKEFKVLKHNNVKSIWYEDTNTSATDTADANS